MVAGVDDGGGHPRGGIDGEAAGVVRLRAGLGQASGLRPGTGTDAVVGGDRERAVVGGLDGHGALDLDERAVEALVEVEGPTQGGKRLDRRHVDALVAAAEDVLRRRLDAPLADDDRGR
jgi:hypothetical protein